MKPRNGIFLLLLVAAVILASTLPAWAAITTSIDYPEEQGRLNGNVKIAGEARATGEFNSYLLEVQRQPDGQWQTIAQGNTQVPPPGTPMGMIDILGVWETGSFQQGEYKMRLTVYAEGTSQSVTKEHLFLGSCTYVTNVSVSPAAFNPYAGETTTVSYTLPDPGEVTIKFHPPQKFAEDVKVLGLKSAGSHTFTWDGKGPGATAVADTAHTLSIKVYHSGDGTTQIYYPSDGLVDVTPTNISMSAEFRPQRNEKCEIHYTIGQPCWVRIGLGTQDVMWALVHNWDGLGGYIPQAAGNYTDYWDGRKNFVGFIPPIVWETEYRAVIWAHTLPDNFMITQGLCPQITALQANPVILDLTKGQETDLSYTLSRNTYVTVKIYDGIYPDMRLVRTLLNHQLRSAGPHTEHWDGLSDAGFPGAPPSPYTFAIEGEDADGVKAVQKFGSLVIKVH